ncbi:hypothetical protein HK405_006942 [Cladochytrium tenue]|nr:hypothetical protein HK405_006942 [Cladochytrium tenue]
MHLSLAVRKFLNLNSYGTKLASGAPHLPGKSYTATKGGYVEMREHLFDHTVGRGNKIADIRPTIDTLVYVEDASHIERLMELLDACPGAKAENQSVTTNATQAASGQAAGTPPQPWAWPCALGRVAAVYRGSGADQDVPALAAAARRLCAHTHCESHALRLYDSRHPISHFDLRQDFGHERDAVPPATSAADLVPTLAGVLQNVAPTAFVYAEVAADAEIVGVRRVDGKVWTKGKYGVYRSAVRLAFDAYMGTRRNVKFSERDALPGDGSGGDDDDDDDAFPTTKAYSWRGGAVVYPH